MDNAMSIHQAIRTECAVEDELVTVIPELQCFLGKRIELIALDLEATEEGSSLSPAIKNSGQSSLPQPDSTAARIPSHSETNLTVMEENQELWRRLRMLRDAMRLTDWMLLESEYPEMRDWFDD